MLRKSPCSASYNKVECFDLHPDKRKCRQSVEQLRQKGSQWQCFAAAFNAQQHCSVENGLTSENRVCGEPGKA